MRGCVRGECATSTPMGTSVPPWLLAITIPHDHEPEKSQRRPRLETSVNAIFSLEEPLSRMRGGRGRQYPPRPEWSVHLASAKVSQVHRSRRSLGDTGPRKTPGTIRVSPT